jgi:hypothetical protein
MRRFPVRRREVDHAGDEEGDRPESETSARQLQES